MEGLVILLLLLFVLMERRSMGGCPLFLAAAVVGLLFAADLLLGCRGAHADVLHAAASPLRPLLYLLRHVIFPVHRLLGQIFFPLVFICFSVRIARCC
jgi:hypothetical protein